MTDWLHPAYETALSTLDTLVRAYPSLSEEQLAQCVVIEMTEPEFYSWVRRVRPSHCVPYDVDWLALRDGGYKLMGFRLYTVRAIYTGSGARTEDQWAVRNCLGTL